MKRKLLLSLAGAAAAGFMICSTAQAASATGSLDALKILGTEQGQVEQAHWWRRHCRHYRHSRRVCWRRGWW